MEEDIIDKEECVMCGKYAIYIDKKTNEPLCESCTAINEGIYQSREERGEYERC